MTVEWRGHGPLRAALLALTLLGILGLGGELVLLEHYESPWQWTPFAVLAVALVAWVLVAFAPSPGTLRLFRGSMAACVAAGLLGLALHFTGNRAFELEMDASAAGVALLWAALRGATPTLAPGALVQLGLVGLALTIRHPAAHDSPMEERP